MPTKIASPHPTSTISLDTWKRLYDAAFRIQKLAPWDWMEETEIFGIQLTNAKEPAFISVMGAIGEHYAVGIYPSIFALNQFWGMQFASEEFPRPEALLETPQLQVAFGSAAELDPAEKKILKALGYSPRGSNAWPYFRSYRPGYLPWFIEPAEVDLLLTAMEQVLLFAPRLEDDPHLLPEERGLEFPVLVRLQASAAPDAAWTEIYRGFPPEKLRLEIALPEDSLKAVRALPRRNLRLEVDAPLLPTQIGEPGKRPKLPYLFMVADTASQMLLGTELVAVETTIQDYWAGMPARLLAVLARNKILPARVAVKTPWMQQLLAPICAELNIKIDLAHQLPALHEFQQIVEHRM